MQEMIKKSTLLTISFYIMAGIIFSNINGLVYAMYGIVAPFSIFILISSLIITFYLFRYGKITLPHHFFNMAIVGYLLIAGISWCFFSHLHFRDVPYYRVFRKQIPAILLVYAFYKYTLYEGERNGLNNVLAFITVFMFLVTMTIPFGELIGLKNVIEYKATTRESGVFSNPNKAGAHINYNLALVLFFILNSRRWSWVFIGMLPLVLYSTVVTFSKSAMVSALLIVLVFLFINLRGFYRLGGRRRKKLSFFLAMILVAGAASGPIIVNFIQTLNKHQLARILQVGQIMSGQIDENTTTHRSTLWGEGLEIIKNFPITGHGFGSFSKLPEGRLNVHNTYLMVLGEAGIFPFIALMIFVLMLYYRCLFWIKDPNYQFLALAICIITTVQVYGAANGGIKTSETLGMTGILFAILHLMKGKVVRSRKTKRGFLFLPFPSKRK